MDTSGFARLVLDTRLAGILVFGIVAPLTTPMTPQHRRSAPLGLSLFAMFLAAVVACGRRDLPDERDRPASPIATSVGSGQFDRLGPESTGIDFQIRWDKPARFDRIFYSQNTGGGVTVGDYDADGLPDIYLTRPSGGNRLYRNLGEMKFQDVTRQAGLLDERHWGTGASFVDIDNDGDLDLYACAYGMPNRLYENQGNGRFRERAAAYGLDYRGASVMMSFADFDRDGDLDGYLVTAGLPPGPDKKFRVKFVDGRPVVLDDLQEYWQLLYLPGDRAKQIEAGQFDHLLRNEGPDTSGQIRFTDVSQQAGIDGTDLGQAATWWDYDRDGWPDLYVANDYWGPDKLYHNRRDGTFEDVAVTALPHTPWSSMGCDVSDVNNDGWLDFLATDMAGSNHLKQKVGMGDMASAGWFLEFAQPRQYSRNALYLNTGFYPSIPSERAPRFLEAAYLSGVANSDWTWSPRLADFDSDGHVDLLVTNGMTRDFTNSDLNDYAKQHFREGSDEFFAFWRKQDYRRDRNRMFRNRGNLRFEDASGAWGFDRVGVSFGAATADFDQDGDLDVVVNNMDAPAQIYRNAITQGNWLRICLTGTASNRQGVGSLVEVTTSNSTHAAYMTLARGWTSTSEPILHFGLGRDTAAEKLTIQWPSGRRQVLQDIPANQVLVIREPDNSPRTEKDSLAFTAADKPLYEPFEPVESLAIRHQEEPFDDFQLQPLLPNRLSQLGPCAAAADLNGDGRDDFYLGGAAGQPGTMLFSHHDTYRAVVPSLFRRDADCEDLDALFVDIDQDGHLDLYVVGGGVETTGKTVAGKSDTERTTAALRSQLRDRLYLGQEPDDQGVPRWVGASADTLPPMAFSGGAVAAADYDGDGWTDLFVGARVTPGKYPLAPESVLLRNDHGRLRPVAMDLSLGMVTDAIWTDIDANEWPDLVVATEWGPIQVLMNKQGLLTPRRDDTLTRHIGWWNAVAAGDVDGDGDMDLVATNFGLNTKYHASLDRPIELYYGDVDGSGKQRIIEGEYEGNRLYPVRGRSCSTNAIPSLGQRFGSYRDFGLAELTEIYDRSRLEQSHRFAATTLETGLWINDRKAGFQWQPLPRIAQIAPSFDLRLVDFNQDGNLDIYLVQNFYSPQRETGRMDGGVSQLLQGDGHGHFRAVPVRESGLLVPGDARCVLITDWNGDGRPDFLIGINDGPWRAFVRSPAD